jgi:prepilin signal peptidase PulO-like enzyme (type II secretory pathway)
VISERSAPAHAAASDAAAPPTAPTPAVVIGAGVVVAGFTLGVLGIGSDGIMGACFLGALAALAVIDFRTHELPNKVVLPVAATILILQLALFPDNALEWVLSSVGCFALLLVLVLSRRGALGMGDATLGLLLGAGLGLDVAMALLIGTLALWPVAAFILLRDGIDARKTELPLGPALALGAAIVTLTS